MSALLLLAVAGCMPLVHGSRPMIRRVRLPALTLLVGGGIVLTTVGITERYLHDFYPALILCAAVGMSRIEVEKRLWARTTVMAALTIISIYINCSFSFVHQRTTSGAPLGQAGGVQTYSTYLLSTHAWSNDDRWKLGILAIRQSGSDQGRWASCPSLFSKQPAMTTIQNYTAGCCCVRQ
jgi:hypothetical protein